MTLDCLSDVVVWSRRLLGTHADKSADAQRGDGAVTESGVGLRRQHQGPVRIVVAVAGRESSQAALAWLVRAREAGAQVGLITDAAMDPDPDMQVQKVRSMTPMRVIRALDYENQVRSVDALLLVNGLSRRVLRMAPGGTQGARRSIRAGRRSGSCRGRGSRRVAQVVARPLRVLMISHAYVSVELAQAKARELARRPGLDVTVVAPSRFFELGRWMQAERPAEPEYRLEVLPVALPLVRGQRHLYFYPRGLVRLMRSVRPDIVDLWEEPYSAVSTQVVLARRAVARHAPLVMNPSQQAVKRQPPPFRWGERLVVSDTRYVVGRSRESIEVFEAKGYRGPSTVIGHGIELGFLGPRDKAESRRELGITHEGPVVAIVGRLVPDKAVDVLLEAVARMPGVGALVVGPGSRGGRPARPGRAPRHRRPRLVPRAAADRAGGRGLHRRATWWRCRPGTSPGAGWRSRRWPARCPWSWAEGTCPPWWASTPAWCGPDDVGGLEAALQEAIDEPEPARGERLARARDHAATFSWKALAERWHAVYDEVGRTRA